MSVGITGPLRITKYLIYISVDMEWLWIASQYFLHMKAREDSNYFYIYEMGEMISKISSVMICKHHTLYTRYRYIQFYIESIFESFLID